MLCRELNFLIIFFEIDHLYICLFVFWSLCFDRLHSGFSNHRELHGAIFFLFEAQCPGGWGVHSGRRGGLQ